MLENDSRAEPRIWPMYWSLRGDYAWDGAKEMPQVPLSQMMLALLATIPADLLPLWKHPTVLYTSLWNSHNLLVAIRWRWSFPFDFHKQKSNVQQKAADRNSTACLTVNETLSSLLLGSESRGWKVNALWPGQSIAKIISDSLCQSTEVNRLG